MEFGAKVFLNEHFSPGVSNVEYFDITGSTNYTNSFTKMICAEDRERIESIITNLPVGGKTITFFKLDIEGSFVSITPEAYDFNPDFSKSSTEFFSEIHKLEQDKILVTFYPSAEIMNKIRSDEICIKKYKNLLSSNRNTYFDYYFDTGIVKTYNISLEHISVIDEIPLERLKEKLIADSLIKEEDISRLNTMFIDIENGKNVNCVFETDSHSNLLLEIKARPIFVDTEKLFMTGVIGYVKKDAVLSDITINDIDDLTGLYRKNAIKKIEEDTINRAIQENSDKIYGIIIIDIDNFKTVNDNYGHLFGDKVLVKVASTLKDVIGEYGQCGRFGGDELCAFVDNVDNLNQFRGILRALKSRINRIAYDKYPSLKVTASIGAASYPLNGKSYNVIFKKADKALYIAKEKGRNRYVIYSDEVHGASVEPADNSDNSSGYITDKNEFTNFLNEISQILYEKKKDGIKAALRKIFSAFSLERVQLYILENGRYKNFFKYGESLEKTVEYADFMDDDYVKLFENNMLAMNFIHNLEVSHPSAYKILSGEGVFSAVECIIRNKDEKIIGLCSFEHLSYKKMFSQNELLLYSYISNMIGVILS